MLTSRQLVEYLLEQKLLDPSLIIAGELKILDVSRRNSAFKVISPQSSYVVKQGNTQDSISTVAHEAAVYQLLLSEREGDTSSFSEYIPLFYRYDPSERVLILELLSDAEDVRQYHTRRYRFPKSLGASMGKALGTLHSSARLTDECCREPFPKQVPWALSIHRPQLGIFKEVSAANLQLIRVIQQSTEFCRLLDGLRKNWHADRLIHRDIRLDNWIIFSQSSSRRKVGLKLVDWEFAAKGDPCWDVGSVFSGYLSFWLSSMPITGREKPERFLELSRYPLERMQPALRSFWTSYCKRTGLDGPIADQWLLRAIRYAAVRLVQTAFEQTTRAKGLSGNIIGLLQLSLNMLSRTHEAARLLLGLPLEHGY
jgi:Phosphotransferase enzyme family